MGRLLALLAALIAGVFIAWADQQTPKPVPTSAAAAAFSAERAIGDVVGMASVPHPQGSPADRAARDYVVSRMTALGLNPQIHSGIGLQQPRQAPGRLLGGVVDNVVGVLPGRDRSLPAVALMAHHDSVPASPGAADDAAGVSTALEVVRAIKARGVPARDVVLLMTDGEVSGLLGANAFFRRDPMARTIGFVFNMEARGSAGRVQMFQTAEQNGGAVDLLRKAVPRAVASSLTSFVYKHMPNDTDFTESMTAGVPGLNFAFIGRQFDYHSPTSTPATLDRGTLQDMGDQVLPSVAAVAFASQLPERSPDLVYNQVPGQLLLAYPPQVGWLILAACAGLLAWGVVRARRIDPFPWLEIARGFGAALFAALAAGALMHFARRATGADLGFLEQRFLLAQAPRWEAALVLLGLGVLLLAAAGLARGRRQVALLPLAAGLGSCLFSGLDKVGLGLGLAAALVGLLACGRAVSRPGAWAGVLLLGLILAIVAQVMAPTAAFILAWPLAVAVVAAALTALAARRDLRSLVLLAVAAAVGLAFAGAFAHSSYLSLDLPELLVGAVLIAALPVWPLAQTDEGAPPARLVGPVLILAGLATTVAVRLSQPYDARYPEVSYVSYLLDQDAHRAWRYSATPGLPAWSSSVLQTGGATIGKLKHWPFRKAVDAAPAPFVEQPSPKITLSRDPDGLLRLSITPPPGVRTVTLEFSSNTAAAIDSVAGVEAYLPIKPGAKAGLNWTAPPQPFDVTVRPGGPGRLEVDYAMTVDRWPSAVPPLPKRPANVMPFGQSDSTMLIGARRFAW